MTTTLDERRQEIRLAGQIGFWSVIALAVLLGVHPLGTTDLYDDGQQFLEHVNAFWVTIHFVAAFLFIALLVVFWAWVRDLAPGRARVLGQLGLMAAIAGTGVGSIHLIATDTMSFIAYTDTFVAGSDTDSVRVGADVLLRLHASTLSAWTLSYFAAVPLLMGMAARADGRFPGWYSLIAFLGAVASITAVIVTALEGQWTTLSEMGIFRPGVVLLAIWLLTTSYWMRSGTLEGAAAG